MEKSAKKGREEIEVRAIKRDMWPVCLGETTVEVKELYDQEGARFFDPYGPETTPYRCSICGTSIPYPAGVGLVRLLVEVREGKTLAPNITVYFCEDCSWNALMGGPWTKENILRIVRNCWEW